MLLGQPREMDTAHFTEEGTEAQRREGPCPSPQPATLPGLRLPPCLVLLSLPRVPTPPDRDRAPSKHSLWILHRGEVGRGGRTHFPGRAGKWADLVDRQAHVPQILQSNQLTNVDRSWNLQETRPRATAPPCPRVPPKQAAASRGRHLDLLSLAPWAPRAHTCRARLLRPDPSPVPLAC